MHMTATSRLRAGIRCITYPCPGSRAMARGCSMPPAISVVRISPLSLATSIWSRLLSIQYSLSVIQSTARPSGVAKPCCTTTSIPVTPATTKLHDKAALTCSAVAALVVARSTHCPGNEEEVWMSFLLFCFFLCGKGCPLLKEREKKICISCSKLFLWSWGFLWVPQMGWIGTTKRWLLWLCRGK